MHLVKIFLNQYRYRSSFARVCFWIILRVKKRFKIGFSDNRPENSSVDIVIPTILKDFELLNLLLESLRFLQHRVGRIYIVSPRTDLILKFCSENSCIYIDELSVLGFGKEKIVYRVNERDRSGWLFQQLLKLSGELFVESDNYIVVDSDTVFLNYNKFLQDGKFVFFQNEEWHQPYFDSFKKIFGYKVSGKLSFTSHMMILNKEMLKKMKQEIEGKHGKKWYEVYISVATPNEQSCISDYDTYANWVLVNYPQLVIQKPFYNTSVSRKNLDSLGNLCERYSKSFKSISFHSYIDGQNG